VALLSFKAISTVGFQLELSEWYFNGNIAPGDLLSNLARDVVLTRPIGVLPDLD